jgi:segregation and condensation protein B
MDALELRPVLEALLFAAAEPRTLVQLAEACEADPLRVAEALAGLGAAYEHEGRGVRLAEEAEGYILITRSTYAPYIARLLRGRKKMRLSRPALETLAIIAYKQPVTKAEVDSIRGVDSSGVLNTLLERELVTIRGRSKVVGRPLLYGTTSEFLSYFGLKDLTDLPRVEELKAIVGEREPENPEAEPEQLALPAAQRAPGEEVPAPTDEELDAAGFDPGLDPALDPMSGDEPVAVPAGDDDDDQPAHDEDDAHPERS